MTSEEQVQYITEVLDLFEWSRDKDVFLSHIDKAVAHSSKRA